MQTRSSVALALILCGLAGPAAAVVPDADRRDPLQPQATELPDAASLFEAHIAAVGGREALAKQTNRVLHGIYRIVSTGDTQILTLSCAAPDRIRAELVAPALGTTMRVTDGKVAWGTNATGTPFLLSEREALELTDSAVFLGEAAYKDRYQSIKTVGSVAVDSRPAYQVDFVTKSGLAGSIYFDAETKLAIGRRLQAAAGSTSPMVVLKEYKDVEGIKLPTKQVQLAPDGQSTNVEIEFRWIDVNVPTLPSFEPPAGLTPAPAAAGG